MTLRASATVMVAHPSRSEGVGRAAAPVFVIGSTFSILI
jgi:hypothetical protein